MSAVYTAQVDACSAGEWDALLGGFDDASLYQTWSYGETRWGRGRLSHLVLRRDGDVVSMAQLLVVRAPYVRAGVAHLRWGPVFTSRGQAPDAVVAHHMADALREEYVLRRGLLLRVLPHAVLDSPRGDAVCEGFGGYEAEPFRAGESYRTMLVDLAPPLADVRRRLDQKWRNQLNRAEKNGLAVTESDGAEGFAVFGRLYGQMAARKGLEYTSDIGEFARIQVGLADGRRMRVLICSAGGEPVAGLVGAALGDTGVYLLGATSEEGMKSKAAYLLQWRMMEWMKSRGIRWYDLGGINPELNPGVYHFKKGFGGLDVRYVPPRVCGDAAASRLLARAIALARGPVAGRLRRLLRGAPAASARS